MNKKENSNSNVAFIRDSLNTIELVLGDIKAIQGMPIKDSVKNEAIAQLLNFLRDNI